MRAVDPLTPTRTEIFPSPLQICNERCNCRPVEVRERIRNALRAVEEIVPISARLIINQAALKLKRAAIQPLIDAFAKAVA